MLRLPFTTELLRKEQSHDLKHKQKRDTGGGHFRKSDLSKLREKGLARQKEMEERLAQDARRREEVDQLRESLASRTCRKMWLLEFVLATQLTSACLCLFVALGSASKSQRTVTVKWDRKQFSHSDDTLSHVFRVYGEIESIKVKSSSAKIVFVSAASAVRVISIAATRYHSTDSYSHTTCFRFTTGQVRADRRS